MPLIKCPKCGNDISTTADACPNCGFSMNRKDENIKDKSRKSKIMWISLIIALVIISVVFGSFFILSKDEAITLATVESIINSIGEINLESGERIIEAEKALEELNRKLLFHLKNEEILIAARSHFNQLNAQVVIDKIDNLGTINLSQSEKKLTEIEEIYNKLLDEQKGLVSNIDKLEDGKSKFNQLQIQNVIDKISEIADLDVESKIKVGDARNDYEGLTEEQQKKVSNYSVLENKEEFIYNKEIDNVETLVNEIGDVNLDSELDITAAERAYDKLSDTQKKEVNNYEALVEKSKYYSNLAVSRINDIILNLAEMTLDKKDMLFEAEKLFKTLSLSDKGLIANDTGLSKVRAKYDELVEAARIQSLKDAQKMIVTKAYAYNEGHYYIFRKVKAIVKNTTNIDIINYRAGFLLFDKNGYPVVDSHFNDVKNLQEGYASKSVLAGQSNGWNYYWDTENDATKVKACIIEVEFADGKEWENPYFNYWLEAEKDKY